MGMYNNAKAKAGKALGVLVVPDQIIADATTAKLVGKGNLCRIKGAAGEFVAFGPDATLAIPSVTTKETIETEAGFFIVVSSGDYIRTSAALRIEITKD